MLDPYLQALRKIESSGNYGAIGPKTRKGNRAYGAYQVMDFNIPGWTQKHYGQQLTPEQFLRNTEAQDAVARGQFGGYVNKYGPDDAASMWFSGRPLKGNTSADVTGTNVPEYVRRFRAAYGGSDPANNRVDQAFQDVGEPSAMLSATTAQPEARPVNGMGRGSGMGGQGGFRNFLTNNRGLLLGLGADLLARGMDTRRGFSGRGMLAGSISDDRRSGRQAEAERAQQQANVTAQYLESMGADPAVVDMARQGMGAQAMSEFTRMNKTTAPDLREVNDKLYQVQDGQASLVPGIDYGTGETDLFGGIPEEQFKGESGLRKEYTPLVKDFRKAANAYDKVRKAAAGSTAADDLALIFGYMKTLDPGSTVREGEFANAQNAGGVSDQILNIYNNVRTGQRLTPQQRENFVASAGRQYNAYQEQWQRLNDQYGALADQYGFDRDRIIAPIKTFDPIDDKSGVPQMSEQDIAESQQNAIDAVKAGKDPAFVIQKLMDAGVPIPAQLEQSIMYRGQ